MLSIQPRCARIYSAIKTEFSQTPSSTRRLWAGSWEPRAAETRKTVVPSLESLDYKNHRVQVTGWEVCFTEIYLAAGVKLAVRDRKMTLRMERLEAENSRLPKLSWGEVINSIQLLAGIVILHAE